MNINNLSIPQFGSLNLGAHSELKAGAASIPYHRVAVILGEQADDMVSINGYKLGSSPIAKELTEAFRKGALTPTTFQSKVLELLTTDLSLDISTASPSKNIKNPENPEQLIDVSTFFNQKKEALLNAFKNMTNDSDFNVLSFNASFSIGEKGD